MEMSSAVSSTSFDELHLLIRSTAEKFSPESELALVQNTRETMHRVNEVRAKQQYHSQEELRGIKRFEIFELKDKLDLNICITQNLLLSALTRQLEEARIQATRPNDVEDDREHVETLALKDKEKYQWAKQALELENENHALESQVQTLKAQIEELDSQEIKVEDTIDKTT
jgi:hypothetical protein